MKNNFTALFCGFALLGTIATATAQTTVNYYITDVGGGNSRITWNVAGSLITPPGVVWSVTNGQFLGLSIDAPGIFNNGYTGPGASIPTPDGSYFHNTELGKNIAITQVAAGVVGSTNYIFLYGSSSVATASGQHIIYTAGTQSVIIPIAFSNFNVGTYQSANPLIYGAGKYFDTTLTVNLTVGAVTPPPTLGISTYSNQPAVFFPSLTGNSHVLQMTTNLTSGNWVTVTNGISISGVIITNPPGTAYFRLQ